MYHLNDIKTVGEVSRHNISPTHHATSPIDRRLTLALDIGV